MCVNIYIYSEIERIIITYIYIYIYQGSIQEDKFSDERAASQAGRRPVVEDQLKIACKPSSCFKATCSPTNQPEL